MARTKIKTQEQKKKEAHEDLDYLRQVENLPDEQSRKVVIDDIEEEKKKNEAIQDTIRTYLQMESQRSVTYRNDLAAYGQSRLELVGFPLDWEFFVISTDGSRVSIYGKQFQSQEGVLMILKSPKGDVYTRGIKVTYQSEYDIKAINILVTQAENTLDSEKGLLLSDNIDTVAGLKKTNSGLYIPDK